MDIALKQRLNLLEKTKQTDRDTVRALENFIKIVENKLSVQVTEENGAMFITHIALAIPRIKNGEKIVPLDDTLLDELRSYSNYENIPPLIKELEKELNMNIPESEHGYIALHLCNLQNKGI